jgi:hypothetical protein
MVSLNGDEIAALLVQVGVILLGIVGLAGVILTLAVTFAVIGMVRGVLHAVTKGVEKAIVGSM